MANFTTHDPGEADYFAIDFAPRLAVGETLSGAPSAAVTGGDTALVAGAPSIVGTTVSTKLSGGTSGVPYVLNVSVGTSVTGRVLIGREPIPVFVRIEQ